MKYKLESTAVNQVVHFEKVSILSPIFAKLIFIFQVFSSIRNLI